MNKVLQVIIGLVSALAMVAGIIFLPLAFPLTANLTEYIWTNSDEINEGLITDLQMVNNNFKILQLTDIQMDTSLLWGITKKNITQLVRAQNPNLIILTGDNVALTRNDKGVNRIIDFFESLQIPWAPVLGNHDAEGRADAKWIAQQFSNADYCLFKNGPTNIHGNGNYVLNVKNGTDIVASLCAMDSNRYRDDGYDYIYPDQIDWYEWNIKKISALQHGEYNIEAGKVVPSLCFFHIPLPEYKLAEEQYANDSTSGRYQNLERICSPEINTGLFEKAKQLGSTKGFFVGHDHTNHSIIEYQGINLVYGLKSSRYSYHNGSIQGGTIITFDSDFNLNIDHMFYSNLI